MNKERATKCPQVTELRQILCLQQTDCHVIPDDALG